MTFYLTALVSEVTQETKLMSWVTPTSIYSQAIPYTAEDTFSEKGCLISHFHIGLIPK